MKKFLVRVGLASVIAMFIYFIGSGKGLPELIENKITNNEEPASQSSNVFTHLRDNVLGGFSLSSSTKDTLISSGINIGSSSTTTGGNNDEDKDPLSDLLQKFSPNKKNSEVDNNISNESKKQKPKENNAKLSPSDVIQQKNNLPEFNSVCFPNIERICTEEGCEENVPKASFTLINEGENIIHKCKAEECNPYEVDVQELDDSKNYRAKSDINYILGKQDNEQNQSSYVEIETSGIKIIIKYGRCLEQ